MNYKVKGAIKKSKISFIVFVLVWIFAAIFLVSTFAYAVVMATVSGPFKLEIFVEVFGISITTPFSSFKGLIENNGMSVYFKDLIIFTFICVIVFIIGFLKARPKNEYTDI